MKNTLRTLFSFILNSFESGSQNYQYQKSHRIILIVIGFLFNGLALFVFTMINEEGIGYYLPVIIFGSIGMLGFIIGFLGNNKAVATIWGNTE